MIREFNFSDKEIEAISRTDLEKLQTAALKKQVENALRTPFYKERLTKAGITSADSIKSLADLQKIPFTSKHDLRGVYQIGRAHV